MTKPNETSKRLRPLSEVESIPEAGIEAAASVMRSGQLFRYGEFGSDGQPAARLEEEFAGHLGSQYAVAINSGGGAMFLALRALGVGPGDRVLTNAFTLAPVPGAIAHANAEPVMVECTPDLKTDVADLEAKARESGARVFLISHMRGHISDMDAVGEVCRRLGVTLVEDCAHTLEACWNGVPTGRLGTIGCFSFQSFKHMNAGEGGMLVTDDPDIAARAILLSGSYMLYLQHGARPDATVFDRYKYTTPNLSMRMSNLTAAVLRPQIPLLPERAATWRRLHDLIGDLLDRVEGVTRPVRHPREDYVCNAIQFFVEDLDPDRMTAFLKRCADAGVPVKWFGAAEPVGFTSTYRSWRYVSDVPDLPATDRTLRCLCDMRIPLGLTDTECRTIVATIDRALQDARRPVGAPSPH